MVKFKKAVFGSDTEDGNDFRSDTEDDIDFRSDTEDHIEHETETRWHHDEVTKPRLFNSKYHLPWRGLPPEIRAVLLEFCLNVPAKGVVYSGILHSNIDHDDQFAERDLNTCYPQGLEDLYTTDVEWRVTTQSPKQRINTAIMRVNRETLGVSTPLLYNTLLINTDCERTLRFLKWLPHRLRRLIKHLLFCKDVVLRTDDYGNDMHGSIDPLRYQKSLALYFTKAMGLDTLELPVDKYSLSYELGHLVYAGHLREIRLCYIADRPEHDPTQRLSDVVELRECYEGYFDDLFALPHGNLDIDAAELDRLIQVQRNLNPVSITLSTKPDMDLIVVRQDLKAAEARIASAIEERDRTGFDYLHPHSSALGGFEKNIQKLQRDVQYMYEDIKRAETRRLLYRKYTRKIAKRLNDEEIEL